MKKRAGRIQCPTEPMGGGPSATSSAARRKRDGGRGVYSRDRRFHAERVKSV